MQSSCQWVQLSSILTGRQMEEADVWMTLIKRNTMGDGGFENKTRGRRFKVERGVGVLN